MSPVTASGQTAVMTRLSCTGEEGPGLFFILQHLKQRLAHGRQLRKYFSIN